MATQEQIQQLLRFRDAAKGAGHIWPAFAACEAVLESSWGTSKLAIQANNLFGQKQHVQAPPLFQTLVLPTQEYQGGKWVTEEASWVKFPSIGSCFQIRMQTLQDLSNFYPEYKAAIAASSGEQFIDAVSRRWSTDPDRSMKVLEIYHAHADDLGPAAR